MGTTWTFDHTATVLADGSYTVQARVIDTAGNRSPLATQTVTVDTSLPSASIIPAFGSISLDLGISASDFITRDRTLLFNGTLTAPLSSDETLQFSIDGGTTWSATTVSGTNWTYDNTGLSLANNTYLAQLRVIDTAGNVGQSAQRTVEIYNAVPAGTASVTGITLDSGTSATDFSTSDQTLVFSLTLAGALGSNDFVQISLDAGSTWHDATLSSGSTYVYDHTATTLAQGLYTLQARVFDVAGNTSAVATQTLQIDTTAPSTGNAVAITTYTDLVNLQTGNFADGTLTNDPAPKLNGTVSGLNASDVVQVYEGTTLLGLATVTGGAWSYQLAATFDGSHTYHVVIADAAGNQGTVSSDFTLIVDTQGPSASATISITTINADSGVGNDFVTNDNTLIFSGVLGVSLVAGESVQVSLDGGSTWSGATVTGTAWTFDHSATVLADATYAVQARVVDSAGNIGQTASQSVVVDTSAPSASITVSIIGISLDTGTSGSDFNTADNTLLFLGNVGLPLGTGQHVEISLDNGLTWLNATNTGLTEWQYDNTANIMPDGVYTVLARVADTAGNIGQTTSQMVSIDSTAPVGNSIEILAVSPDSGSPTDFITNSPNLIFSGIITSPLGAGGNVEISVDNGLTWANAVVTGTTWSFDNTANTLADGSYNLQARITDVFGNVEQTAVETLRIDTVAPSASATVAITTISVDTGTAGDFVTSDNTLTFSGTLGAALQSNEDVRISLDGGATWQIATVTGTTWSFDNTATALADGSYTIEAQVFDTAGNLGQSASTALTIDTATPMASVAISGITTDTGTTGDFITSDQTLLITTTLTGTLNAGENVQISLDNAASWNNASLVSGSTYAYDHSATPLAEGSYTFLSRVIDGAGNTSAVASQAVTVDITGPTVGYTVSLDTYTDNVFALLGDFGTGTSSNDTTPVLNGTVSGLASGDTVRVYEGATLLGVATVSGNTWNYQLGTTAEGAHTYHAVISDVANNNGLSSSNFTLTVDTVAPSASETITIGAINADSEVSGDFNTNDNTLIFSGVLGTTLAAGHSVQFSLDGGATYNAATVSGTTWSYDNSANALADNTYNLKARVVDAAGNAGQTANQTLVVDTSAPAAAQTIAFTSITLDSGTSSTDYITSDKNLVFNGVLGAALLAGESVQVRLNGASWFNASTSALTWSHDHTATTLADGAYTVDARVVDIAGNVGQTATQLVTVDSTAPTATLTIGAVTSDTGITTDFKTQDTTLVFSGTLSATLGAGEEVLFSMDGGTTYFSATVSGTTWSYDNSANTLSDGIYNLRARVVDAAGNFVNTANQTMTVDTTPPSASITITSITTDSAIATDFITTDTTLIFSGTLSSTLATDERVEISLDGGTSWSTATVTGTSWSYNNTANVMASGAYTVVARVIDIANNLGLSTTQVVQIDTVAPTATATISAITTDSGTSSTDFITNDQTLTISATVTGTVGSGETVQISLDNGSTWNTATLVSGSLYSFNNTANTLAAGSYNFRARVVDTAGNIGTVSAATAVTIDLVAPAMSAVSLTAITTDTTAGLVLGTGSTTDSALNTDLTTRDPLLTVNGSYTGNVLTGEFLQISTDGGTTWTNVTTFNNTAKTWSYTDPVARTSATTYQLRAIDIAGNVATGTASTVVTVDSTAPLITSLIAPVLTSAFDTGVVGDNITTTTTAITFSSATSGLGEVGSTLVLINDIDNDGIYSQGIDSILAMTTVAAGGSWSLSTAGQAVGSYHLAFMGVDAAGNRSLQSSVSHLRVVSSDLATTVSAPYGTTQFSNIVGLSESGSFNIILFNNAGTFMIHQPGIVVGDFTSTSVSNGGNPNAAIFVDFLRTGYQGVVSINASNAVVALTTLNNDSYSVVTLSGNNRTYGGVVAYDKTGDGYLDFAFGDMANTSLTFVTNTSGTLTWMNGTATTGTGRPTGTGVINNYAEVSAVDLNNNGTVDIVEHTNGSGIFALTTFMNSQLTTNTFVLTSLAGVFATPSGSTNAVAMTWADFNNDGFMDLYLDKGRNVTNTADSNAGRIYWNNQSGGFGTAAGTAGGTATYFNDTLNGSGSLALDWNHDGKMDIIEVPANGVSGNIVWYANQGSGFFDVGASIGVAAASNFLGVSPMDFNWDGAADLFLNVVPSGSPFQTFIYNNKNVEDGTSMHLRIFDLQGVNVFYGNTVQLFNSSGVLVSSQIINPQSGLTTNDSSALVYFYGLSASETYTAVLLKSVAGVSSDVSGVATLGGNSIENVNTTWTGLTAGLATSNYVLSAEAGNNNANGNFIGTGYNDTFFATAGTDTFIGGGGWLTHYGTPAWQITRGEDIVNFTLAGTTGVTVNLNTATAQATGFNTVTLTGIEGIIGGGGNDSLTANSTASVNSLLDGRGGNDTYTITAGGHTLLTFTNVNNSDATGGNGTDTAIGFGLGNINSVAAADMIDLSALLTGYTGTAYVYTDVTTAKPVLDKASEGLMNYLSVTNNGTNTSISVDRDGAGSTFSSSLVLTLNGVATDMETLLINHQLIV
ncbi:beta strand repeat-containing protein [Pseudomonas sp. MDT1-17]